MRAFCTVLFTAIRLPAPAYRQAEPNMYGAVSAHLLCVVLEFQLHNEYLLIEEE